MKRLIACFAVLLASPLFAQSSHNVTLTWTASTDAAANPTLSYNVYRATGACPLVGSPASLSKVGGVSALTYSDTAVSVGQTYCYVVRATLNGSESGDSPTAGGTIPIAPVGGLTITVK